MLIDTTVWLALLLAHHPFHQNAQQYVSQHAPLRLCTSVQISLMRLLTTTSIQQQYGIGTLNNQAASDYLGQIRANPNVQVVIEPTEVYPLWIQLANDARPAPKRWMDAHLAALALHHGWVVVTLDQGFAIYQKFGVQVHIIGK
jgi:toxin-antitoxin system PIN domain toxin